ncbi:MAG TPA: endonuclease/exonuclease/phosphatase family protein, partial [Gemmatimonadales bacterium]|nr:endonuclease/exonuclease/phosphatase family protein [Gemmatimonadales bacterium]
DHPVPAGAVISADELPVNLRDSAQARANRFDPGEDAIDFLEALEGMRITVAAPLAVSAIQVFGAGAAEVFVVPDGGAAVDAERRTEAGGILLQSGPENRGSQNPERLQVQLDTALGPGAFPQIAVGDRLEDVTGVLRYDFGNYEVAATEPLRVRSAGRASARSRLRTDELGLAFGSYNVLNLGGGPEDSLQRRLLGRQIAGALGAPAILALQEIQDDSGERDDGTTGAQRTLALLAEAIRGAGGPGYRWCDVPPADGRQGGAPGGNIRNAYLYDPARVRLVRCVSLTPAMLAAAGAHDPDVFRDSRDPLLAVVEVGRRRITFINNHLTSRFGSTPVYGAVQPFVQAGEAERAGQVRALNAYVRHLLAEYSDAAVVVLGDMNTFDFSDDLATLLPGTPRVLYALADLVPTARRYSYNYEGNSQTLDHVFVTWALRPDAEIEYVHLNADYPALSGAAASDHDPVVARVRW